MCLSIHPSIHACMHLCIYVFTHLCIDVSMHLCKPFFGGASDVEPGLVHIKNGLNFTVLTCQQFLLNSISPSTCSKQKIYQPPFNLTVDILSTRTSRALIAPTIQNISTAISTENQHRKTSSTYCKSQAPGNFYWM
jgi:hypothetical protein